ncbi:hypothetical protein L2E82_44166 [Cichorium intybus]|uniref:Uncharacterized protein n=1 Tax=Cichorium intybus TaxID=13427 RepID=A0ACB8ZPF8_CICIN|nr:hypothetical protein L2E82_44166 [Cichorium intybus]
MSRWLPLVDDVLSMVIKHMPDPIAAQSFRMSRLLPKREILDNVVGDLDVSKMFAVPIKMLPQRGVNGDIDNLSSLFFPSHFDIKFSDSSLRLLLCHGTL